MVTIDLYKKLNKWINGKRALPYRVEIWPTRTCNLKCVYCIHGLGALKTSENELPLNILLEIVHECHLLGVKECFIGGGVGEPMLRKEITLSLTKNIKRFGMYGLLVSNGTLFNLEDVKSLVEIGWDEIFFSIDAPDAEIHDYLRGVKGAFERVKTTTMKFKYWKEKKKTDIPKISINTVLTNKNYTKLSKMVKFAHEVGANGIYLQPLIIFFPEAKKYKINNKQMSELQYIIKKAEKLAKDYGIKSNMDKFTDTKLVENANELNKLLTFDIERQKKGFEAIPCFNPFYHVIINENGKVGPCANFCNDSPMDIHFNKLEEIWYGKYFDEIRQQMFLTQAPDKCAMCCIAKIFETRMIRQGIRDMLKIS